MFIIIMVIIIIIMFIIVIMFIMFGSIIHVMSVVVCLL